MRGLGGAGLLPRALVLLLVNTAFQCLWCKQHLGGALQMMEICYLWYRQYFAYVAVLTIISCMAIAVLVVSLSDQHKKLVRLVNERHLVPMVDRGWVRAVSSHKLVPGDVIVVQRGRAPVDMVLLRGSCIVEESMLSGEVRVLRLLAS